MLRTMMKSKIHRATVTQADLHYVGSVTVDEDLLDAADLLAGELVHIVDVTNGARLETYTIAGERGSGVIGINGAAARLVHPGDIVILIGYGQMETAEAKELQPHVVFVDADNKILATGFDPAETFDGPGLVRGDLTAALACRGCHAPYAGSRAPAAPAPGWTTHADVVVIGSGIAGLTAALRLRGPGRQGPGRHQGRARRRLDPVGAGRHRRRARARATPPTQHEIDTLVAGAGACDLEAVRVLVTEGPEAVRELIALGTNFDHDADGELSLTREGGHHRDRIAHAGGDATGAEIQRALIAAVERRPRSRSSSTRWPSTCCSPTRRRRRRA